MPTPSEIIAAHIRAKTLNALQDADEIGGPDRPDYVRLMLGLADECQRRAETAREQAPEIRVLRWAQKTICVNAEIAHTGGGCTALRIPARGERCYWLVTDDNVAPESMHAAVDETFAVGLYSPEGDQWICFEVASMQAFKTLYEQNTDVAFHS
jgi:hypothetical protein